MDKVVGALDVPTLQENMMNITCKLQDAMCLRCQSGADPVLLKFICWAQSRLQEFLTSPLHNLEESLRLSQRVCEQSKKLLTKQAEIKLLKGECKHRRKMTSTDCDWGQSQLSPVPFL